MKYLFVALFLLINYSLSFRNIPADYEVAPWRWWKKGAITYSFDDGCRGQITNAIPSLNKYGLKGTFNVITNWVSDWNPFKQAAQNGHEIASHTVSHTNLDKAGESELSQSKNIIQKQIGQECVTLVYPNCVMGNKYLMSKYYIAGRTCSGQLMSNNINDLFSISSIIVGSTTPHNSVQALNNLAENAAAQGKWIVYLIHGVGNDGGYSPIPANVLDQHFAYVKQQDKWYVATFKEIVKFIIESNNLVIYENKNGNSYTLDVSVNYQTSITKLDALVTIARKVNCSNPKVLLNGSQVFSIYNNGKVLFDVVPGNRYTIQCQ